MQLIFNTNEVKKVRINKPELNIGSDPGSEIYLPFSQVERCHALIQNTDAALWLCNVSGLPDAVHVNGRPVLERALLNAGDEIFIGARSILVQADQIEKSSKSTPTDALSFSDRLVLRVLSGPSSGKAYALVNSLCIGRSLLSEVQIDDFSLAERQILLQRQGNEIFVKNLSPVIEMRINGWVCTEAVLAPGAQLCIEQHRFCLQAPCHDFGKKTAQNALLETPMNDVPISSIQALTRKSVFSRGQWILIASAVFVALLLALLLTFAP